MSNVIIWLRNFFSRRYRLIPVRITVADACGEAHKTVYYKLRKHPHRF